MIGTLVKHELSDQVISKFLPPIQNSPTAKYTKQPTKPQYFDFDEYCFVHGGLFALSIGHGIKYNLKLICVFFFYSKASISILAWENTTASNYIIFESFV